MNITRITPGVSQSRIQVRLKPTSTQRIPLFSASETPHRSLTFKSFVSAVALLFATPATAATSEIQPYMPNPGIPFAYGNQGVDELKRKLTESDNLLASQLLKGHLEVLHPFIEEVRNSLDQLPNALPHRKSAFLNALAEAEKTFAPFLGNAPEITPETIETFGDKTPPPEIGQKVQDYLTTTTKAFNTAKILVSLESIGGNPVAKQLNRNLEEKLMAFKTKMMEALITFMRNQEAIERETKAPYVSPWGLHHFSTPDARSLIHPPEPELPPEYKEEKI